VAGIGIRDAVEGLHTEDDYGIISAPRLLLGADRRPMDGETRLGSGRPGSSKVDTAGAMPALG